MQEKRSHIIPILLVGVLVFMNMGGTEWLKGLSSNIPVINSKEFPMLDLKGRALLRSHLRATANLVEADGKSSKTHAVNSVQQVMDGLHLSLHLDAGPTGELGSKYEGVGKAVAAQLAPEDIPSFPKGREVLVERLRAVADKL